MNRITNNLENTTKGPEEAGQNAYTRLFNLHFCLYVVWITVLPNYMILTISTVLRRFQIERMFVLFLWF